VINREGVDRLVRIYDGVRGSARAPGTLKLQQIAGERKFTGVVILRTTYISLERKETVIIDQYGLTMRIGRQETRRVNIELIINVKNGGHECF